MTCWCLTEEGERLVLDGEVVTGASLDRRRSARLLR
jgi:hypothetical protein